jgi:hypothetical protein
LINVLYIIKAHFLNFLGIEKLPFNSSDIYNLPHTSNEIWTLAQVDIQS